MRKLFIIVAAIGILYSCGGNTKKDQEEGQGSVSEFSDIAKQVKKDGHNAKNPLVYEGTYKGKLPTGSGEGMTVEVTLRGGEYTKKVEYVGKKDSSYEEKGKYTWNDAGNTITLEGVDDSPNQYFVEENSLVQLDMDGNRITGNLADMYILKK